MGPNLGITEAELQRLRDISIHSIISVRETGRRIDMRCPLDGHNDSDPSFSLYPDNSYHCFGCGRHGNNAVDFIRDFTGKINFVDILVELVQFL